MFKLRFNNVFFIIFWYFFLINFAYASNPLKTTKTCSDVFDSSCSDASTNDTCTDDCIGKQYPSGDDPKVVEVYISASSFFPGEAITVTCQFRETAGSKNYEYIWYYNTATWIKVWEDTSANELPVNKSVVFNLNYSEGTHIVRCIYSYDNPVDDECADSGLVYDNDDVNFTVTAPFLKTTTVSTKKEMTSLQVVETSWYLVFIPVFALIGLIFWFIFLKVRKR